MESLYIWVKVLHVISVISWMAGLLYLPRLFVYHSSEDCDPQMSATFKTMERRLFRFIMRPAMLFAWSTGFFLAYYANVFTEKWFITKFLLVLFMTVSHFYMATVVSVFERDRNTKPQKFFRILNEIPTLLMIGIVAMVIAKPF